MSVFVSPLKSPVPAISQPVSAIWEKTISWARFKEAISAVPEFMASGAAASLRERTFENFRGVKALRPLAVVLSPASMGLPTLILALALFGCFRPERILLTFGFGAWV